MSNNKQATFFPTHLFRLSLIAITMVHSLCFAVCDGESEDDYYGNAQICDFKNAVEGTDALTPSEQTYLGSVEQTRIVNRWYVRGMVGKPKIKLSGLSNTSTGLYQNQTITQGDFADNRLQFLIAVGHLWEQWAFETELLFSKKLNFTENPLFSGTPFNVSADVQVFAMFINLQYILPRFFSWYPTRLQLHLDAGAGGAVKVAEADSYGFDGSPRQSNSVRNITPAGNLGVGARYQITNSILVDIAYRFFDLGKTKFSIEGAQFQANKLQSTGFFAGVMYEF